MISVKNLWKRFGKNQVLKGLSLEVKNGETVVILGRSGVGKSVLLRHIIGLEAADEGTVEINGQEITPSRQSQKLELLKNMGMLFQGAALFDSLTVAQNVGFYLHEHGDPATGEKLTDAKMKERVQEALHWVGLEDAADKIPSSLSGGMRKRAALARLLAYRPQILLYDEPTTGLDPITSMQINELICKTQKELQATSIVVTHDLLSASIVGDRLAFHHDGKIALIEKKEAFLKSNNPLIVSFLQASSFGKAFALK